MKTLIFLLLISTSLFAQTKYPYKSFIYPDTICVLSLKNVQQLNLSFVKLDFQRTLTDSFRVIIHNQNNTIKLQDINASSYKSDMKIKQNIIDNSLVTIGVFKDLDKKNQRQIKFLKLQRTILFGLVVAGAIKAFVWHP